MLSDARDFRTSATVVKLQGYFGGKDSHFQGWNTYRVSDKRDKRFLFFFFFYYYWVIYKNKFSEFLDLQSRGFNVIDEFFE